MSEDMPRPESQEGRDETRGRKPEFVIRRDNTEAFYDLLRTGMPIAAAAQLTGFSMKKVYDWLKRGKAGDQPYDEFYRRSQEARRRAERTLVMRWVKGAKHDWRACRDLLRVLNPAVWLRDQVFIEKLRAKLRETEKPDDRGFSLTEVMEAAMEAGRKNQSGTDAGPSDAREELRVMVDRVGLDQMASLLGMDSKTLAAAISTDKDDGAEDEPGDDES